MTTLERTLNTILEAGYSSIYNEEELIKITYLVTVKGYSVEEILEDNYILEDTSLYYCDSFEQLAEEFVAEGLFGAIPDSLVNYIDYEALARDLQFDYDLFEIDNETYILRQD